MQVLDSKWFLKKKGKRPDNINHKTKAKVESPRTRKTNEIATTHYESLYHKITNHKDNVTESDTVLLSYNIAKRSILNKPISK